MKRINISDLDNKEFAPGIRGGFIHSENMTFVYWTFKAGAELPEHRHVHEQVVNMLEGEFELSVAGNTEVLKEGSVVIIPSNQSHSGKAVTPCRILDVFYPVREDFKKQN